MQSPIMTDISNEIRADDLQDNQNINQSFENAFDMDAPACIKCIQPSFFSEFLGDHEESTEISSLVLNLNLVSISWGENKRENMNLDMDDSQSEILEILKMKGGRANTPSVPLRPTRNIGPRGFGPFGGESNYNKSPLINNANGQNVNSNNVAKGPNGARKVIPVKKISLAGRILSENSERKCQKNLPERACNPVNRDF